jgi:carbon monoxide dehydrogenase subunit G
MRIEEIVEIDRPLEEVFSYVTNPENLPEWSSLVLEVHKEAEGDLQQGDRFTTAAKFLGRRFETPFEVSDHEPHRRHSDRSMGGPFEQEYTYALEETGEGGTRLTYVAEGEPGGFFRLVGPLLERAGRRQFRADLQSLKDMLEAEADT